MIKLFNLRVLIQFPLLRPFGAPLGLCCGLSPQIFSEFRVLRRIPLAQLNDHTKMFVPIPLRRLVNIVNQVTVHQTNTLKCLFREVLNKLLVLKLNVSDIHLSSTHTYCVFS